MSSNMWLAGDGAGMGDLGSDMAAESGSGTSAGLTPIEGHNRHAGTPASTPHHDEFPDSQLQGKYTFVRYLGHGSYGHVCEARSLKDGTRVAIKKVPQVFVNDIDAKRLLREIRILRLLKDHDCVIGLYDVLPPRNLDTFDTLFLVFEFVDTDLAKLINSNQYFSVLHVQYILYQILVGLEYIHSCNIAHRDIKPANILVNEDCTLKICDFGLARGLTIATPEVTKELMDLATKDGEKSPAVDLDQMENSKMRRQLTRHVVTRWYRAPEVILLRKDYKTAVDMWSVGCILAELFSMQEENVPNPEDREPFFPGGSCFPLSASDPFAYTDRLDQLNVIFDVIGTPSDEDIAATNSAKAQRYLRSLPKQKCADFAKTFPGTPAEGIDLLGKMLQFNQDKRISAEDALNHPFLRDVRDEEQETKFRPLSFEFEDVPITRETIRKLIVDEVLVYNPMLERKLPKRRRSILFADGLDPSQSPSAASSPGGAAGAMHAHAAAAAAAAAASARSPSLKPPVM